jgi:glycosyltransferase involved in cell wall biosynthesis
MKTLTIFTPTYNRAHTLARTYRSLCNQTCADFEWLVIDDGSTDGTRALVEGFRSEGIIPIDYVYQANGGLYTGYNTAYLRIQTELCTCVDSDDFMPTDAVERIVTAWRDRGGGHYAGLIGLDFDATSRTPLGGYFPTDLHECYFLELYARGIHRADSKPVMRTALMREVAPMKGFPGEKNFNPVYMLLRVCDRYPVLLLNENLCYVDYQTTDSMSSNIFRQYADSPRSFAQMRRLELTLRHNTTINRYRSAMHYVAESLLANDRQWWSSSPRKWETTMMAPLGYLLARYIRWKSGSVE